MISGIPYGLCRMTAVSLNYFFVHSNSKLKHLFSGESEATSSSFFAKSSSSSEIVTLDSESDSSERIRNFPIAFAVSILTLSSGVS